MRAPDRGAVQRRLESVVRRHRFTIAVIFPVIGASVMLASRRIDHPAMEALASSALGLVVGNVVMALPLAAGLLPIVDRRAAVGLGSVAILGYVVETMGVATGWPYGAFAYETSLGPSMFGVPVALPLFWLPILVNGLLLALRYLRPVVGDHPGTAAAAVAIVVGLDGILDPGAVALGFWGWEDPGRYYGVPLKNFAGWVLSGGIGVTVLALTLDLEGLDERLRAYAPVFDTLITFVVFWGAVNLAYGQLVPVAGAVALGALLLATEKDRYLPADGIG